MTDWDLDFSKIERWAYTDAFDDEFAQYLEADCDLFEHLVSGLCDIDTLLRFAGDPACVKRPFFAQLLLPSLSWLMNYGPGLPFYPSRFAGLVKRETFFEESAKGAADVYKIAEVVDKMRCSGDVLLQDLAAIVYDFRNDRQNADSA